MIDDDSNELIPSDGGGDNDENAEDGNADDVQSVSIIQDEQGITFLGDAGVIDLWLKSVYGQINVYGVTTKSERHKRSYWTRTADGNGIGGRKAPVPYGS